MTLPLVPHYQDFNRQNVYPAKDDFRCVWCGSQWNQTQREIFQRTGRYNFR